MPPRKSTTKRPRKAVAKRSGRRGPKGPMSAQHKQALAEGRTMSGTVNRYLSAIEQPKKRGRRVTTEQLEERLHAANEKLKASTGVEKLQAAQQVRTLTARIKATQSNGQVVDIGPLEAEFVKIAKKFGENKNYTFGDWRAVGVPADVLAKAGIKKTRSAASV